MLPLLFALSCTVPRRTQIPRFRILSRMPGGMYLCAYKKIEHIAWCAAVLQHGRYCCGATDAFSPPKCSSVSWFLNYRPRQTTVRSQNHRQDRTNTHQQLPFRAYRHMVTADSLALNIFAVCSISTISRCMMSRLYWTKLYVLAAVSCSVLLTADLPPVS